MIQLSEDRKSVVNSKGATFYFNQRKHLMFFSKKQENVIAVPPQFDVVENAKTGMVCLKKKVVAA